MARSVIVRGAASGALALALVLAVAGASGGSAGCAARPAVATTTMTEPETATPPPGPAETRDPAPPPRIDLATGESQPTSIAVSGGTLMWTDVMGAIWAMPARGGERVQLSEPPRPGFAFHLVAAGRAVLATSRRDLLRVQSPAGPVVAAKLALPEHPESSAADDRHVYLTLFKRPEILRVPLEGGDARKLAELPRAILAVHAGTLYAASYSTGALVAIRPETGAARTIARGLGKPTAIAADGAYVYLYCERDQALRRIDAATGEARVLARGLVNSDDLVIDGGYVYTRTWGARPGLLRVATDGGRPPQTLVELPAPTDIAIDDDAIYVASRDARRIVRLEKASLAP